MHLGLGDDSDIPTITHQAGVGQFTPDPVSRWYFIVDESRDHFEYFTSLKDKEVEVENQPLFIKDKVYYKTALKFKDRIFEYCTYMDNVGAEALIHHPIIVIVDKEDHPLLMVKAFAINALIDIMNAAHMVTSFMDLIDDPMRRK